MKRSGHLFDRICSFENLCLAARRARRGKRHRPDVAAFDFDLEPNLLHLRDELMSADYRPGAHRTFRIREPKERIISAAPYRDRVVHHALCSVIEPLFERRFVHRSYANRSGKGTHAALRECTALARRHPFALKCDVTQYFPSIDHGLLLAQIERAVKCRRTLELIVHLAAERPQPAPVYLAGDDLFTPLTAARGLPIGNLTSQLFANVYLNGFDHFVSEELQRHAYIRFVDDFVVFGDSAAELRTLLPTLRGYLTSLRLSLHPRKCSVAPVRCGVPFLGWRVYPDHLRLRRSTGVRIERGLRRLQGAYARGDVSQARVRASVMSWIGHLQHGDTWRLRDSLLERAVFARQSEGAGREAV